MSTNSDGVDAVGGAGLLGDQTEDSRVPWAELKELVSNNLEIIFSVNVGLYSVLES